MTNRSPSAAAIAASIAQSSRHRLAEHHLRELRAKRETIRQKLVALCNGLPLPDETAQDARNRPQSHVNREIVRLEAEETSLNHEIAQQLAELQPMRAADGEAVLSALSPMIERAALDALEGLQQFKAAMRAIAECTDVAARRRAPVERVQPPDLGHIEAWLHRRAARLMKAAAD